MKTASNDKTVIGVYSLRSYATITERSQPDWKWTIGKLKSRAVEGWVSLVQGDGKESVVAERTLAVASEAGAYWFRCRAAVGGFILYALVPWPEAQEVARAFGVLTLEDPRA